MDLTNDDVAEILALLDSLPYDELDLETPRFRLTLRRTPGGWTEESQTLAEPTVITSAPNGSAASPAPALEAQPTAQQPHAPTSRQGLVAVPAPLPGTFYRAPRPGAAPFVEVGDQVLEDTVVAIVETMKLMNSVHAGTRGRVAEICLENAEPVGQSSTLMWIEPA
ncbi:MAG TPA: biotin/lipoyl-containing protein [Trebonia sp.]|jgi:acetyl-CoA carboxylase biotin carboxyl carrier protein|nr:biotin/lipoyl-containing protein [Trebonia sp.]